MFVHPVAHSYHGLIKNKYTYHNGQLNFHLGEDIVGMVKCEINDLVWMHKCLYDRILNLFDEDASGLHSFWGSRMSLAKSQSRCQLNENRATLSSKSISSDR